MGGGNSVEAKTELQSSMKASVEQSITSSVDASSSAYCTNIQEAIGNKGCKIRFSEQTCEAQIIAHSVVTNESRAEVSQSLLSTVSQAAEAMMEIDWGALASANESSSSTFVGQQLELATSVVMNLESKCVKDIRLTNIQSAVDNEATDTQGCEITFGKQASSAEVIADCAISQSSSSKIAQDMTSVVDQTATATFKAGGIFDLLMAMLLPLILFLLLPILIPLAIGGGLKALMSSTDAKKPKFPTPPQERAGVALIYMLVLSLAIWYPGLGAWYFGAPPWPYPFRESKYCSKNSTADTIEEAFVNKFAFYDGMCLLRKSKGQSCLSEEDKLVHYKTCGLFSSGEDAKPLCDDSRFVADKGRYLEVEKLCATLPPDIAYCEKNSLAAAYLPSEGGGVDPKQCKFCSNVRSPAFGMMIDKDAPCDETTKVSYTDFAAVEGTIVLPNPNPPGGSTDKANTCGSFLDADKHGTCHGKYEDLKKVSEHDCMEQGYQMRKRVFAHAMAACNRLNEVAAVKSTPENPVQFRKQCRPLIGDYFRCDMLRGTCDYTPTDTNNKEAVLACRNDFSECKDKEYVVDESRSRILKEKCTKKNNDWKSRSDKIVLITGIVYAVVILLIVYLLYSGARARTTMELQMYYYR